MAITPPTRPSVFVRDNAHDMSRLKYSRPMTAKTMAAAMVIQPRISMTEGNLDT